MSTNAATADAAPAPTADVVLDNKMPAGIPFIVSNEFAERFCFYGINSILTTYMVHTMHFGDAKAAAWQSMFKSGAYFFPLLGAIVSDVFWGKFRTIMTFSISYILGCVLLALIGDTDTKLAGSLLLVAIGTGGIKPCVSTNVGDQFTAKNQHLIEKAFSWFYWSINAGSSISIALCPYLLKNYSPMFAFGMPAIMMLCATGFFYAGRKKFAHVPPAGKKWIEDVFSKEGGKLIGSLLGIYVFVVGFWMLWDQSNGNTWTIQAASSLMDKHLFGIEVLPAQVQVVNGLFILVMAPLFSYVVYPFWGRFFRVTPLRKIGIGLFTVASSFVIVAWIEREIQEGRSVSMWWQIVAYIVLTASEILVSITALEFSYKQAPLRMKSFIMGLFLLTTSIGNFAIAAVNNAMVKPVHAQAMTTGDETWVSVTEANEFVTGQKIDFTGDNGVKIVMADGKTDPLEGTFLVQQIDAAGSRLKLMDAINRQPLKTEGAFTLGDKVQVATYRLVGPMYFLFFVGVMTLMGIIFIFVAMAYKEQTHVRTADAAA
jgi:POT family proton-dependent oligopeptide transporter